MTLDNERKKVVFIAYHDYKTEARTQDLLRCAMQLGDAVFVSFSKADCGCKCVQTGGGRRSYSSFIKGAKKAISEEKPDIVILHDDFCMPLLLWIKRKWKDLCVIYDSSELYIDYKPKCRMPKTIVAWQLVKLEKKYLKKADMVIAANEERSRIMKEAYNLEKMPYIFENIHRIDDTIDIEKCERLYGDLFKNPEDFVIVYAGGIAEDRKTYELVKAAGKLDAKFKLVVAGVAQEADRMKFEQLADEIGKERIRYIGFVDRSTLKYLFQRAKASVSAFKRDCINNTYCASGKVFESLFEGTPIIATENPPLKRLCEAEGIGVCNDNFEAALVELERNYKDYLQHTKMFCQKIKYEERIEDLTLEIQSCFEKINI